MKKRLTTSLFLLFLINGCASVDSNSYEGILMNHAKTNRVAPSNWCGVAVPVETFRFAPRNANAIKEYYSKRWIRKYETQHGGGYIGCRPQVGNSSNWRDLVTHCEKQTKRKCEMTFVRSANPDNTQWYSFMDLVFADVDAIIAREISERPPAPKKSESVVATKPRVDLTNLTDSVMNGWRRDYQNQMQSLLTATGCSGAVDFKNLTDSVMNGWRRDYQNQMSSLLSCTGCSSSVDLTNLTDSVMNGWRRDYKNQMSSLLSCVGS